MQTENGVDQRREKRRAEAQAIRRQRPRRGDHVPELRPRQLAGLGKRRRQGDEHDEAQIKQGVTERQTKARQYSRCFAMRLNLAG